MRADTLICVGDLVMARETQHASDAHGVKTMPVKDAIGMVVGVENFKEGRFLQVLYQDQVWTYHEKALDLLDNHLHPRQDDDVTHG